MIRTPLLLRIRDLNVFILYDRVLCFGGLEAPISYMTLMYYDATFFDLMKNIYDDRLLFYLHVQNVFVKLLWSVK